MSLHETCVLSEAAQARQRSAPDSGASELRSNLRGISRALSTSTGVGTLLGVCDSAMLPPDGAECEESELGLPTVSRDPATSFAHTGLIGDVDAASTISVYPSNLDSVVTDIDSPSGSRETCVSPMITHPLQRLDLDRAGATTRDVLGSAPSLDDDPPRRSRVRGRDSLPELPDDSCEHAVNVRRGARPTLMSSRSATRPSGNLGNTYRESVRALASNVRSAAESIARLLAPPRQRPRPN